MATSDVLQAKIQAFARQLADEFGELDEENSLSWLDAIETRAVAIGDAVSAELLQQQSADPPVAEDESICLQCGNEGRYKGQRKRKLIGRRGPVTITEPEFECTCCRKSFFPSDQIHRR